jgi:nucleoid DNA-binding protein
MAGKTVTRADVCKAVYQKVGLSLTECASLVGLVLTEITDCLERGETVKLSSFGSFVRSATEASESGAIPRRARKCRSRPGASWCSSRPRS